MSWLITPRQPAPAVIGEPFGGGFFAGYISHTADGNPTHALIVAPRATGATGTGYTLTTNLLWKTATTTTTGATSVFDGTLNTAAMVTAGIANHPAAKFCVDLSIGGFTDWYLPSRFELDIAYFNLKPTADINSISFGVNNYSVPKRLINNTETNPLRTNLSAFTSNAQEAFQAGSHWSSTQNSATEGIAANFLRGFAENTNKTDGARVRAFRRIAL